jgi:hypothetical protein
MVMSSSKSARIIDVKNMVEKIQRGRRATAPATIDSSSFWRWEP